MLYLVVRHLPIYQAVRNWQLSEHVSKLRRLQDQRASGIQSLFEIVVEARNLDRESLETEQDFWLTNILEVTAEFSTICALMQYAVQYPTVWGEMEILFLVAMIYNFIKTVIPTFQAPKVDFNAFNNFQPTAAIFVWVMAIAKIIVASYISIPLASVIFAVAPCLLFPEYYRLCRTKWCQESENNVKRGNRAHRHRSLPTILSQILRSRAQTF